MSFSTPVAHADLDAFYASVEMLRDPSLKGRPVIVGGTGTRGVVTSASYEARRYGVRSAMPSSQARRLCPHGVFISPDFDAYAEKSREVRKVFESFSPSVEPLSLDEAFLDLSGASRLWSDARAFGEALRGQVRKSTGLVVSVGAAPNKFVAKVASDLAKPDGLLVVDPEALIAFLHPLGVERLWGVGEQGVKSLHRLGLRTIGDVAAMPRITLERVLGSLGGHIAALAAGRDERRVTPSAPRKSVGAEETFEQDLTSQAEIGQVLLSLSDRVASRLRAERRSGRTVTAKVRFSNFLTQTRSETLTRETDGALVIYRCAAGLTARVLSGDDIARRRIRLLGVSVSNLLPWPASEQLTFDETARWPDAEAALDLIRTRFGKDSAGFGSLAERPSL